MSTETFEVWGEGDTIYVKTWGEVVKYDVDLIDDWGRMLKSAARQTKSTGSASKLVLRPHQYEQ